jgi:hypothetical protein
MNPRPKGTRFLYYFYNEYSYYIYLILSHPTFTRSPHVASLQTSFLSEINMQNGHNYWTRKFPYSAVHSFFDASVEVCLKRTDFKKWETDAGGHAV